MTAFSRLLLLLLATGCAAKTGRDQFSRNDAPRAAICTRHFLVARDTMHRLMASFVVAGTRQLPDYILPAIAGEVALRMVPSTPARPIRSGVVSFTVRPTGEAESIQVDSGGDTLADSMMLIAIQQAGSLRQFAFQPGDRHLRPLRLQMRMWTEPGPGIAIKPDPKPLLYTTLTVGYQPVTLVGNPLPAFPELGRRAGISEDLLTQFVINIAGRAEPGTFRMLKATYKEYVDAMLAVLPFMRFRPGQLEGCPVAVLVQLPFHFAVGQ